MYKTWQLVLLATCFSVLQAEEKKVTKLQIGVKKRVEDQANIA
jgi:hypothetical protein